MDSAGTQVLGGRSGRGSLPSALRFCPQGPESPHQHQPVGPGAPQALGWQEEPRAGGQDTQLLFLAPLLTCEEVLHTSEP